MEEESKKKKSRRKDIIITIFCIAFFIMLFSDQFFLPGIGVWGLINESIEPIMFLVAGIYIAVVTVRNKRANLIKKSSIFFSVICVCGLIGVSVWMGGKIVSDLIHGPITREIYSVKTTKSGGLRGFTSYYLETKNGTFKAPISRYEYYDLEKVSSMEITYYPKTRRILEYKILGTRPNKWSDFDFEQWEKNKDVDWNFEIDDEMKELMEKYNLENQNQ